MAAHRGADGASGLSSLAAWPLLVNETVEETGVLGEGVLEELTVWFCPERSAWSSVLHRMGRLVQPPPPPRPARARRHQPSMRASYYAQHPSETTSRTTQAKQPA